MRVAILQSNYVPWYGYFELVNSVDLFVFYDSVQYTKNDWRNRNKILSNHGSQWLSIPVHKSLNKRIMDVEISRHNWHRKHLHALSTSYGKAPNFQHWKHFLHTCYDEVSQYTFLSDINSFFIKKISQEIGITTTFVRDVEIPIESGSTSYSLNKPSNRLISILKTLKASQYISGENARGYLDARAFSENNIEVNWFRYGADSYFNLSGEKLNENLSIWHSLFCDSRFCK